MKHCLTCNTPLKRRPDESTARFATRRYCRASCVPRGANLTPGSSPTPIVPAFAADDALCREAGNPDLWFSDSPDEIRAAVAICEDCPVRMVCLQYALEAREQAGVWGATTKWQRRELLRGAA